MLFQPHLRLLDETGIRRLHEAAVAILRDTGVNVHQADMRRLLADHGAQPGSDVRVYLPPEMIERALATARREVTVFDRNGQPALSLAPYRSYFGTGSDLLYTREPDGARRPAALDDVGRTARLCDALPEVDFVMSFALPGDRAAVEPAQYYRMVGNTVKPVIMTSFSDLEPPRRLHEMACLLAGANLIHDIGYLDAGAMGSLESIVLAADAIKWTKSFLAGLRIDDETLALDAIREVSPGRQFPDHDHTLRHFRETLSVPYALVRHGYDRWIEEGAEDYAARARRCAEQLLKQHQPPPLDPALDRELHRLT